MVDLLKFQARLKTNAMKVIYVSHNNAANNALSIVYISIDYIYIDYKETSRNIKILHTVYIQYFMLHKATLYVF